MAFAGDAATSWRLIKILHARVAAEPKVDPCAELFAVYQSLGSAVASDRSQDCEFLILRLTPQGKRLAKITRDGVSYVQRAYIGDGAEYARFKDLKRPYSAPAVQHVQQADGSFRVVPFMPNEGEIEFAKVSDAMEALTRGQQRGSVGAISGCITRVVDARISGGLEYLQSVEASLTPWEGNSGFSVLAANSGARGIGIYYRSGKVGFIFVVGDDEPCRKEYADTIEQFAAIAKAKYGLKLEGGTWGA